MGCAEFSIATSSLLPRCDTTIPNPQSPIPNPKSLFDLVRNQDDEIFIALLLQAVRASGTREHGSAGRHVDRLVVDGHDAFAAQHVVDLVLVLLVVPDAGAGMQRALAKHELHSGRLVVER